MDSRDLLTEIRSRVTVDIDSNDHNVAARHTDASRLFTDMTSNAAIVYGEATKAEQNALLHKAIQACHGDGSRVDNNQIVDDVIDHFVCSISLEPNTFRAHTHQRRFTDRSACHYRLALSYWQCPRSDFYRFCLRHGGNNCSCKALSLYLRGQWHSQVAPLSLPVMP